MCHMYASTDPTRYESTTRSVRLQGFVTSVRLENEFWTILEELVDTQAMSLAAFISKLHSEVTAGKGEVPNLASLLRVTCAVYLHSKAAQPAMDAKPLRARA